MVDTKQMVRAQCPACLGDGYVRGCTCRGCFGLGEVEVKVETLCPHEVWDEVVTLLDLFNVKRDPEAYNYREPGYDGRFTLNLNH